MAICDDFCITDFDARFDDDADDTRAWRAALRAIRQHGGGRLLLPSGTSITSRALEVPSGIIIEGKGPGVTKIRNAQSDVFRIGRISGPQEGFEAIVEGLCFKDLAVQSEKDYGGHIFVLHGGATARSCRWSNLRLKQDNPAKQIFRRVTNQVYGGLFDCLWEHLHLEHGSIRKRGDRPTVPAFEVSAPQQQFNSNTLRNLRCENSWSAPFFRFWCDAEQRNNNCLMSEIDFRQCYGGMVHWFTAGNWTCEGLVQYDVTQYLRQGDGLFLGKVPNRSPTRHMTFIGCDRRSRLVSPEPPLDPRIDSRRGVSERFVDVRVAAAEQTVLINCGESAAALYTVDANNLPLTWIGFDDQMVPEPAPGPILLNKENTIRIGDGAIRARTIERDPRPPADEGPLADQGGREGQRRKKQLKLPKAPLRTGLSSAGQPAAPNQ